MIRLVTLVAGFFLSTPFVCAQEASFEGLGNLPGGIYPHSDAQAVSIDGSVVVGGSLMERGVEAFRWESGSMRGLGILGEGPVVAYSRTRGTSANGGVVVGESTYGSDCGIAATQAFRWEDGEMKGLGFLYPESCASTASDVSSDGFVVVGSNVSDGVREAFRWEDGEMVGLGDLDGGNFRSEAYAVSGDGSMVVGVSTSSSGTEAFRWTEEEGMVGLGSLGGAGCTIFSGAFDVSTDGSVIVGRACSANGSEAFRWENGQMEGLGNWVALGTSADGSVIVGRSEGGTAIVWRQGGGMQNLKQLLEVDYGLDLSGWELTYAADISDEGTIIVGTGINPDGNEEAWRAVLPPPIPAPENDDIANAVVLTDSGTYSGTNVGATLEDDEPEPSCTNSNWTTNFSVWWSFTATDNGTATIDTNGSLTPQDFGLNTILSLHIASNLSEVACDDDSGDGFQSLIEDAPVTEGETYLIRVAGYNESDFNRGEIQLTTDFEYAVASESTPGETVNSLSLPTPNPVNDLATLTLAVAESQNITVEVFDVTARHLQTLYDGVLAAKTNKTLTLNAVTLPAGVYVIRATGDDFVETQNIIVVH